MPYFLCPVKECMTSTLIVLRKAKRAWELSSVTKGLAYLTNLKALFNIEKDPD